MTFKEILKKQKSALIKKEDKKSKDIGLDTLIKILEEEENKEKTNKIKNGN